MAEKTFYARGKRGIVSTALVHGKKVLIKEKNPGAAVNTVAYEAQILQVVNKKGIGPLFIALNNNELVMEFIEGPEFGTWIEQAGKAQIRTVLLDILEQCHTLDMLGINKLEMTHPHKHILIRKSKPVFIDFERARRTERPKNLTQVCQYITSTEMSAQLAVKGIAIPRAAMLQHARAYKQGYSRLAYERMREVVRNA